MGLEHHRAGNRHEVDASAVLQNTLNRGGELRPRRSARLFGNHDPSFGQTVNGRNSNTTGPKLQPIPYLCFATPF